MKKILLMCFGLLLATLTNAQITLGSGTTTGTAVPWSNYYGYSYAQQILTKANINASGAGSITGLKFYLGASQTLLNSDQIVVYLGLTNKTSFSSDTDWIPTTALTQVFSGTVVNNAGVITVTFATPFAYDNVNNLVIAVDENKASYDTAVSGEYFYNYTSGTNQTLWYRSDTVNPDPANVTQTGTRTAVQSVVTLSGLTPNSIPACPTVTAPLSATATDVAILPTISWNAVSGATGYRLSVGTTTGGTDVLNNVNLNNVTSYTFSTALQYNKQYFYTVSSYNGTINSPTCTGRSFTTINIPCPAVTAPAANATGLSLTPTITWSAVSGATGYRLSVGTTAGGTNIVNNQDLGTALTYTFPTVLTNGTKYFYTVNSYNTTTTSSSCTERNFTTVCNAVTSFPWNENFDGLTTLGAGLLPNCWQNITGGSAFTSANAASNTYNDPRSASNYVTIYYGTTASYLWAPPMQLTAGVSYDFSFYFVGDGFTGWTGDVVQNTSQSATGATVLGTSFVTSTTTTTSGTAYTKVVRSFTPSTTGVYYFGVKVLSDFVPYYLGFDDFNVQLTPACSEPTSLAVSNITTNSATVSWALQTPTPIAYEYYLSTTNTAPTATTTPTGSNTPNGTGLSNLLPGTTYYFWVRSSCSGGVKSSWAAASPFTTLFTPPVNDNCSGAVTLATGGAFATNAVTTSNQGATLTTDATAVTACQTIRYSDVWFKVVVPASGALTVETQSVTGSNLSDTVMGVYSGTCGALVSVGCDDDSSDDGNFSKVSLTGQVPGSTLYIGVWNYSPNNNGQFKISAYTASLGTTETSVAKNNLSVYPNPFSDVLNISDIKNVKSISVIDVAGRLVKTFEKPTATLQLSELNAGMYMVVLNMNNGTKQTIKTIKK